MIGRRRRYAEPEHSDLTPRAEAAARAVEGGGVSPPAGLSRLLARALGLRRRRPRTEGGLCPEAADPTELRALREELTRELSRVARAEAGAEQSDEAVLEGSGAVGSAMPD